MSDGTRGILRILLIEIFADHAGFDDRDTIVDESRNDTVRIDRQVLWLELIFFSEVELHVSKLQALLMQDHAHLLAAGGMRRVVQVSIKLSFGWPFHTRR